MAKKRAECGEKILKLVSKVILILLAPQLVLGEWSEGQEGQLVIRGGWVFDSISELLWRPAIL